MFTRCYLPSFPVCTYVRTVLIERIKLTPKSTLGLCVTNHKWVLLDLRKTSDRGVKWYMHLSIVHKNKKKKKKDPVHLCNDESAAHIRVIVESSHGHRFPPNDIIMEIPTQDRTISMNPDEVKVGFQAWLIKSLMQPYTSDAVLSQPLQTRCLCLSITAWEDKAQREHILTKHWTYLYPETMYIS